MNKKAKILIMSMALISIMTLGGKVAFGNNDNSPLGINDVISNTVSNNADINLFKEKIRVKEKYYTHAEKKNKNDDNYAEDMKKDVLPLKEEIEIKDLEWQRSDTQDDVVVEAQRLYYKILIQNQMIETQEKVVKRLSILLENKKKKIEIGTESSISLVEDETNLKNAQVKLQELKTDKETFAIKLNMKMGTPISGDIKLKQGDVPYKPFEVKKIEEIIDTMLKKHHTIKSLEKQEFAKIKEKNITHQYANAQDTKEIENVMNPNRDYKSMEDDMEDELIEIKYKMNDEKKKIQSKIRIDYNTILNLQSSVDSKKQELDKAQIMLKAEKAKLNAERSTKIQCDEKEEDVLMKKLDYENAKLEYYIATENFKNYARIAI